MGQIVSKEQLKGFFERNLPNYMEMLSQMVAVNSFTMNSEGIEELGQLTAGIFATLGFSAELIQSSNTNYGKHLILTRKAKGEGAPDGAPTIGLISHLDTVFPAEEEIANNFHWRPEGDRIYGPGTVDIKGGTIAIYMILDALEHFAPEVYDNTNWKVLLNAAEEQLTDDFSLRTYEHLPEDTLACLVFEAGNWREGLFNFVRARKGRATYEITVTGRAAHSGSSHERGANALVQMARVIDRVASFTNYDQQITFNVGTLKSGTVMNRVPHEAKATGEMRAFDQTVFDEGVAKLRALEQEVSIFSESDEFPCTITINIDHESAPWNRNEATDRLYEHWNKTAESLGWQTIPEERGGLSDGNYMWQRYPTLDGLGPSGANSHCSETSQDGSKEQEYVLKTSFVPKAVLNTMAVLGLIR
jgi:glutamate carboxypeptidase